MLTSPRRTRAVLPPTALVATALLLAGCGAGGTAADAASTAPSLSTATSAAPSTSTSTASGATGTASSSAGSSGGCAPTGQEVPSGAATAATADLDHDGRADELWLADSTTGSGALERRLGVRTASGAVFSTTYTSASPQGTTAVGQALDGSTSIVLLSDGRQVPLYAVVTGSGQGACQLVASANAQGQQYAFDLGFTGYGSGVACVPTSQGGSDLALYGLLVVGGDAEGDLPGIQRTRIDLSDGGRQARNGPTDSPAELQGINPEGAQVAAARQVSCGDQGPDTAVVEPAS
ncbi:hypothetical protein [Quadrisphaera sp. INWT6]|uniref:hypothetical protein n=1 Tax=Quadrisphaera sp. INWT6 TaxID=2596917 RepID=UPI00189256F4|nr:hypothetical protein [Quadrisphaera sp. INWT6]